MFRAHDSLEINAMSRPLHVILSVIPHWLEYFVENSIIIHYTRICSYIVMMTLPIQWVMGILPPFEPFFLWTLEQIQVFMFGGTPTPSLYRSLGQITISITHVFVMIAFLDNQWLIVMYCGITGYILSLDWFGLFDKSNRVSASITEATIPIKSKMMSKNVTMVQTRRFLIGKEILTHAFFFCINMLVVFMNTPNLEAITSTKNETLNSDHAGNDSSTNYIKDFEISNNATSAGWMVLICYICSKLSNELQKVFLLYGLFKSPLYHGCATSHELFIIIWQHVRAFVFNFVTAILLTYFVTVLISPWEENAFHLIEIIAYARIYRWIWQNTESALIELTFFHLYSFYVSHTSFMDESLSFVTQLPISVQLLLLGIIRDRLKQIVEKTYLVVSLAVSSLEDRASRRSYAGCLFQVNLIFLPVILCFVCLSSVISAPILAAFTLPLYFLAYPRPMKFWPHGQHLPSEPGNNWYSLHSLMILHSFLTVFENYKKGSIHLCEKQRNVD